MITLAQVVGYLVIGGTVLLVVALAAAALFALRAWSLQRFEHAVSARTTAQLASLITSSSYWFSENIATHTALHQLGERIHLYGGPGNVSDWREQWHKALASEARNAVIKADAERGSQVQAALPLDHPVMIDWQAYQLNPEFQTTLKWARLTEHTKGSLWAAFVEGWKMRSERAGTGIDSLGQGT